MGIMVFWNRHDDRTKIHFLDVGQGDAALISYKSQQILVDGGPDETVLERLRQVMPFYDGTIEWVILSHADKDHLAGLLSVLESYEIELILMPRKMASSQLYARWLALIEAKAIPVTYIERQEQVLWQQEHLLRFFPAEETYLDRNEASLVFTLKRGEAQLLFTGDIEKEREDLLVTKDKEYRLRSTLLKVAHHGSKTSSTNAFLDHIAPDIAVISAGRENKFGHPHPQVLYRLEKRKMELFRTDLLGTVSFSIDEGQITHFEPFSAGLWKSLGFR